VNCSQARALLAIYRENNKDSLDSSSLEEHLAHCTACNEAHAQYARIGEHIRSMPAIAPSPDARNRLMQALANEHMRFLQSSPSSAVSKPVPSFLAPFLKDLAHKQSPLDTLAAFSTANTGPLPIIKPTRTHPSYHMSHIAVLGLAASFLIILMTGGLTALLMIAKQGSSNSIAMTSSNTSIHQPSQVDTVPYTTQAAYPHIASAMASADSIYYTAYNDSATAWMLEKLDNSNNQMSTPLLSSPATNPMLVLGGSKNWLIWLQIDAPRQTKDKIAPPPTNNMLAGSWSLHALAPGPAMPLTTNGDVKSITLHKDNFDTTSVPSWVNSPIQGFWLVQNKALVAFVDSKGNSHLVSYQLDTDKVSVTKELAHATSKDHILTSPTANSDGTDIYWSEEWMSDTNNLIGKIWTQQTVTATPDYMGRWAPHTKTETYLFRPDENLFRPQIVNNTLFLLNSPLNTPENTQTVTQQGQNLQVPPTVTSTSTTTATAKAQITATAQATVTVQATATEPPLDITTVLGGTTKIDPTIRMPQIDERLAGKLLAFTADGSLTQSTPTDDNKLVSSLQGGSRFLIWQNAARGFEMYDVVTRSPVSINPGDIPKDAAFMTVNGDTAVWAVYTKNTDSSTAQNETTSQVTFGTFKWPSRQKANAGP